VPLTRQFAGLTASGFAAVTLAVLVTVIGEEKLAATAALTLLGPETHLESKTTTTQEGIKAKQTKGRRTSEEEGRMLCREVLEENPREEKTISNRPF